MKCGALLCADMVEVIAELPGTGQELKMKVFLFFNAGGLRGRGGMSDWRSDDDCN